MINREDPRQMSIEEFKLPFAGELDKNNRWVRLAESMPWEALAEVYNQALSKETGRPALSARVVVGALIVKHMLKLTDEETIAQIRENPYLQYFLGYPCYRYDHVFEPSLFVSIRKRLGEESLGVMNDVFIDHTKHSPTDGKPGKVTASADSVAVPDTDRRAEGE